MEQNASGVRLWRQYASTIIGLIGLIGTLFGFYAYYDSKKITELTAITDPAATDVVSSATIEQSPIKVIKENGEIVQGNLKIIKFYVWNSGDESIKKESILSPIKINFTEKSGEIIDFKLLKTTREVSKIKLSRSPENPQLSLDINFFILEPNDGFSAQILYSEISGGSFAIEGIIERTPAIITNDTFSEARFWYEYGKTFIIIPAIAAIFLFFLLVVIPLKIIARKFIKEETRERIGKFGATAVLIFFAIFILIISPAKTAKENAKKNITLNAPKSIQSE